jgi:threonine dehydrogenase-like Zn-dependent dehydrogenase
VSLHNSLVATLTAPKTIEWREEHLTEPGPHELLCQTVVSAISPGTELAAYRGAAPLRAGVGYPRLMGYCNVARVVGVGEAVTAYREGDRILSFMSHRTSFVISENDVLMGLPEAVRSEDAVCAYLFHLGYNAVLRANVRAGSRVCVLGLGALGLTTVACAALAGADVWGISDQPYPSSIAREVGARDVVGRASVQGMLERGELPNADVVVVTTNGWADWEMALQLAAQFGVLAVLGFPGRDQGAPASNPLDSRYFYTKQLRIEAVGLSPEKPDSRGFSRFNERDNLAYLVDRISTGHLKPERLVSGTFPGADLAQAYESLARRDNSPITYLLEWQ